MTFEEKKERICKYEKEFKRTHPDVEIKCSEFLFDEHPELGIAIVDMDGKPYIFLSNFSELSGVYNVSIDLIKYLEKKGYDVLKHAETHVEKDGIEVKYRYNCVGHQSIDMIDWHS